GPDGSGRAGASRHRGRRRAARPDVAAPRTTRRAAGASARPAREPADGGVRDALTRPPESHRTAPGVGPRGGGPAREGRADGSDRRNAGAGHQGRARAIERTMTGPADVTGYR